LPLPNVDKLYYGFGAGKQLVISCLYGMNCRLNSNHNPVSLGVSHCHVTTSTNQIRLKAK